MKRCSKCGEVKEYSEFYQDATKRDGLSCRCIACIKKYNKPMLLRASRQRHREDPRKRMLVTAKSRARKEKIPFDLSVDDLVVPDVCPILGIPLFVAMGRQCDNSPSLDRLVPEMGYVRGNVSVISLRANRIKNDATPEELRLIYSWYVRRHENSTS